MSAEFRRVSARASPKIAEISAVLNDGALIESSEGGRCAAFFESRATTDSQSRTSSLSRSSASQALEIFPVGKLKPFTASNATSRAKLKSRSSLISKSERELWIAKGAKGALSSAVHSRERR